MVRIKLITQKRVLEVLSQNNGSMTRDEFVQALEARNRIPKMQNVIKSLQRKNFVELVPSSPRNKYPRIKLTPKALTTLALVEKD